jgi:hypothetical protein
MKPFRGWAITAGLIFAATAANAQTAPQQTGTPQYQPASDFEEPYADVPPVAVPPQVAVPNYGPRVLPQVAVPQYGPGVPPDLLPPREVYAVLRENGFSPLGVPRLRGLFYSIAAIDRRGGDGRLVIDARDGRIVRFVPAEHFGGYGGYGGGYGEGYYGYYGSSPGPSYRYGPLERLDGTRLESPPRPPAAVPKLASRMPQTVPMPKAAPARPAEPRPLAEKPAPLPNQQSAVAQIKPAEAPQAAAPAPAPDKPATQAIQPTQPMPKVQGLE